MNLRFFSIRLFSRISWRFKESASLLWMIQSFLVDWVYAICFCFSFSTLRILFYLCSSSILCFWRLFWTFSNRSCFFSCCSSLSKNILSFISFIRVAMCFEWSTYCDKALMHSWFCYSYLRVTTSVCFAQKSYLLALSWARLFCRLHVALKSFWLYSLRAFSIYSSWISFSRFLFLAVAE